MTHHPHDEPGTPDSMRFEPVDNPPTEPAPFQPYVPPEQDLPEFTIKSVLFGALFGVLFGASTVYLALKAGLTVSASIPIAVLSISVLRVLRGTILENNMVQTIGSAGESVASGVAFTVPALLFLGPETNAEQYFERIWIMMLAAVGGILGVLMMVPLRRALIVGEHGNLPYPEGTACADVLVAGERGGRMAGLVFGGVGLAVVYKALGSIFAYWKEAVAYVTPKVWQGNQRFPLPNATVQAEISPEYLGVGYILGPKIAGIMVSGSVLAWIVLVPLFTVFVGSSQVMSDLIARGVSPDTIAGWSEPKRIYEAYLRYIGAGAVTAAGIITLVKTLPTIVRAAVGSFRGLRSGEAEPLRTERDMPIWIVAVGSVLLVAIIAVLPVLQGDLLARLLAAVLILVFGFLFVTVSSRIVGLIGSSSNPISGMTIATLLGTALVFMARELTGAIYQPVALSVGAIVCIAAANAGATSQDLKTGFLVGATPIRQQVGLLIGVLVSAVVIGFTLTILQNAYANEGGIGGSRFPAPQAKLMATVIQGVMGATLPWEYIMLGAGLAVMIWLCGVSPLAWAVGAYLPIGTTLPIFFGGALRGMAEWLRKRKGDEAESEISAGTLFATGLVAGGALTGVFTAVLKLLGATAPPGWDPKKDYSQLDAAHEYGKAFEPKLIDWASGVFGEGFRGFADGVWALVCFGVLAAILFAIGTRRSRPIV